MPSRVDPRSGPFPVYAAASPPAIDVGMFVIAKTGVNMKAAGTTAIFTVPIGRSYTLVATNLLVTAVTSGGAGVIAYAMNESSASRTLQQTVNSGSTTPVANQTIYANGVANASQVLSTCAAGSNVQIVMSTSNAGSSAVTGTVFCIGFYVI